MTQAHPDTHHMHKQKRLSKAHRLRERCNDFPNQKIFYHILLNFTASIQQKEGN